MNNVVYANFSRRAYHLASVRVDRLFAARRARLHRVSAVCPPPDQAADSSC